MPPTLVEPLVQMPGEPSTDRSDGSSAQRAAEPGEEVEVNVGGGLDPSPSRRLSVAQLQHALRLAYGETAVRHPGLALTSGPRGALPALHADRSWVSVVPAHAGAGASTVALALADAAADPAVAPVDEVHLIECADPSRSGLAAVTNAELGVDATGSWQVGRRGTVTVHRHAPAWCRTGSWVWPATLSQHRDVEVAQRLVIVDLSGIGDADAVATNGVVPVVLVMRASVPGVRAAARLLDRWQRQNLDHADPDGADSQGGRIIIAAVGPSRWPGPVTASLSLRLAALRRTGRVVAIPLDAGLLTTGATSAALPRRLRAAARTVLGLLPDPAAAHADDRGTDVVGLDDLLRPAAGAQP